MVVEQLWGAVCRWRRIWMCWRRLVLAELLLAVLVLLAAAAVTLPAAEGMAVLQVELVAVQWKAKLSVNASGGEGRVGVMSGIGDGDCCNGRKCG
jgi:autotransporter translocation and assembly factor TamB